MHSLFEEQVRYEEIGALAHYDRHAHGFAEAMSFVPSPELFALGPDEYLEQVARIKRTTSLPVVGSLNGTTPGGWVEYARLIAAAGADALELNTYVIAADPAETGDEVESRLLDVVRSITDAVAIPVTVKLQPTFSSLGHLAARLVDAGARGLTLFNRFYVPEYDLDELDVVPRLPLSTASELGLRLQWVALLGSRLDGGPSLTVSGGVHDAHGAVKAVLAGADAVQMVSALLRHGPKWLAQVRHGLGEWLEEHGYESLGAARGALDASRCPDPSAYQRGNYIRALQSYRYELS